MCTTVWADCEAGRIGLKNLLWEPTAAGNGGDDRRAETKLIRLIHEFISTFDLRGKPWKFADLENIHKHVFAPVVMRLTKPERGRPSNQPSASERRAASWCSQLPAQPESDAHSPPPHKPAARSDNCPATMQRIKKLQTWTTTWWADQELSYWPSVSKAPFLSELHRKSSSLSCPKELQRKNIHKHDYQSVTALIPCYNWKWAINFIRKCKNNSKYRVHLKVMLLYQKAQNESHQLKMDPSVFIW